MDRMNEWLITGERPSPLASFISLFAKSASGGKSKDDNEDDEDDEGDDDDEDDDEDDEDDDLADLTDDELRAELKKEREKVARQSERAARRRKREKKEREAAATASKKAPAKRSKDDEEEDAETARENGRREGESAGVLRAKKAEAKSALLAAGVNPVRADRAVGLLDLDELDLDDDGLDGVDEAIDDLRKEWPELFAKARRRRGSVAGEGDRGGDSAGKRGKQMTPSERQAAIATRKR